MRFAMGCLILVLLSLVASTGSDALAESMPAFESASIHPADHSADKRTDQQPFDPNAAKYASTVKASAGVHQDTGAVIPEKPFQDPAPGKPKSSFWQRFSGRTVDCSSGVCIFK